MSGRYFYQHEYKIMKDHYSIGSLITGEMFGSSQNKEELLKEFKELFITPNYPICYYNLTQRKIEEQICY
jgi:hypothetical protein